MLKAFFDAQILFSVYYHINTDEKVLKLVLLNRQFVFTRLLRSPFLLQPPRLTVPERATAKVP